MLVFSATKLIRCHQDFRWDKPAENDTNKPDENECVASNYDPYLQHIQYTVYDHYRPSEFCRSI